MIANSAMSSADKRAGVVITGVGLVTPLGSSLASFQAGLRQGQTALAPSAELSTRLPPGCGPAVMLGRVGDFGASTAIDAGRRRRMPRLGQFAVVAAQQALGMPGGEALPYYGKERVGVVLGTGLGSLETTLEFELQFVEGGLGAASPALFPYTVMNASAALVAMELGLLGPNLTLNHRDLSLTEAVASACDLLCCGRADAVLAGGCDELGTWLLHAYARLGLLPQGGAGEMLPYDRHRQGFCPGEGAVVVLLERAEDAAKRGAQVLAQVAGIGRGGDDRPRLGWSRPGEKPAIQGASAAVTGSLKAAGIGPEDVDFIAGSGNGTELDLVESMALRQALGPAAERVPIASVLGQTGEWLTSSGVRLAAALYALSEQALPGTSCREPDPEATLPGLRLHPGPSPRPVRNVLVPTFAQGGGSVALLLSHPSVPL